jgi:hypothetical protein
VAEDGALSRKTLRRGVARVGWLFTLETADYNLAQMRSLVEVVASGVDDRWGRDASPNSGLRHIARQGFLLHIRTSRYAPSLPLGSFGGSESSFRQCAGIRPDCSVSDIVGYEPSCIGVENTCLIP